MHKSEKSNQYSASTCTAALDFLSLTVVQESTYYSKVLLCIIRLSRYMISNTNHFAIYAVSSAKPLIDNKHLFLWGTEHFKKW